MPRRPDFPRQRQRQRPRPPRPSRWLGWWTLWRIPTLLLILMLAWWFAYRPWVASQAEWAPVSQRFDLCGTRGRGFACVTDGDTVTLGHGAGARRIRLTGFDTPEIAGACPAESAAALRARQELQLWLNRGTFEWDGGADPPRDRYGRELRSVRRTAPDGSHQPLADHMIAAKLAEGPGPWDRRDWCR